MNAMVLFYIGKCLPFVIDFYFIGRSPNELSWAFVSIVVICILETLHKIIWLLFASLFLKIPLGL